MDENALTALSSFFSSQPAVDLAYLFGSEARGTAGPLSDVDVAVLLHPTVPADQFSDVQISLLAEIMGIIKRNDIDLVVLNRAPAALRFRVIRDGQVLFCRDGAVLTRFRFSTLRDYHDTRPLRELQEAYLRRRIKLGQFGRPVPYRRMDEP